jgi:hypothetical protein
MEAVLEVRLIKGTKYFYFFNNHFKIIILNSGDKFGEIEAAQEAAYFKKLVISFDRYSKINKKFMFF